MDSTRSTVLGHWPRRTASWKFTNRTSTSMMHGSMRNKETMRAAPFLLLVLVVARAWADPVKVTETADTAYYIDPASINAVDAVRRVSVVQDYSKPDAAGVRSRSVSYE